MGAMATWQEFEQEVPEFAARVLAAMTAGKHKTMATLRKDGSPRISGTELEFKDHEVWLGSMPGAMKALDLKRDPRVAVHGPSIDPDPGDPNAWPGEAKLSGLAVEITDPEVFAKYGGPPGGFHLFRIDIKEAAFTHVEDPFLVIESWAEGRGLRETRRT
ncbi:pyridoxamine 5'-phosphate oxidase [Acrocarpospora corrugata]|uniref:Pyridoxamine 5'-phosphate oxidase n=2 Tax=Acrocarpospora corrugata TaxID=35763 RepID=A0A5M3VUZ8_9ACTN|nr:pyridoxamine 5'-phosphate oxidase [Acrocarpospora corrugata]